MVQVIWEDAHNIPNGWQHKEEYARWKDSGVGIVSTIGHLLEKTAKHIIIGSMVSHDGVIGQVIKIPKTWCKIRVLK